MKITTLTPAHVDTIRAALRIAIRTERTTLHHERPHMLPGAIDAMEARIRDMVQIADGLSPSLPPELPMEPETGAERLAEAEHARLYLYHRAEADKAFKAGDGAAQTGHAARAHSHLRAYAIQSGGIPTDEAAARIRQGRA